MLIDHIRTDRARQKGKKPLPETVFAVVAAIVKTFKVESVPAGEVVRAESPAKAPADRLSLFPLLTQAQWQLTQEIIDKFNNPYLIYARSPEDFTLSLLLYRHNPDLTAATLQEHSLGWLLTREAKQEAWLVMEASQARSLGTRLTGNR